MERSAQASARWKQDGVTKDPIILTVANRLFGQSGSSFHADFLERLKTNYDATLEMMDFARNPSGAAKSINNWVEQQTKQRIRNLIPEGALNVMTRLILVNAIYLKAPWQEPFKESATKPLPFHVAGGATVDVPTMSIQKSFGYMKYKDFTAVTIPYDGGEIQFLILLPDAANGLAGLESKLPQLASFANLPNREVVLHLPKFKIEPPTLPLSETLQALGMKTAFDPFRANFDRLADDPLFISGVFHKTFLSLDEKGTEAAAATAVAMQALSARPISKPVEVQVDHPFVFAIQHRASGACLFLGHVVDPR
jgi:serpin B